VAAVCAALAPTAEASTLYVAPDGLGIACSQDAPCSATTASNRATTLDDVLVAPGDYAGALTFNSNSLAGMSPTDKPHFHGRLDLRAAVIDIEVTNPSGPGIVVASGRVERVIARGSSATSSVGACEFTVDVFIKDSICAGSPTNAGIVLRTSGGSFLDRVSAFGCNGLLYISGDGPYVSDSILSAPDAPGSGGGCYADVSAVAPDHTVHINQSNYDAYYAEAGASIDDFNGQTALPLLTEDLHQRPGSPTINANAFPFGDLDVDGEPRVLQGAQDIGADEIPPAPTVGAATASNVTTTSATVGAIVEPNGAAHSSTGLELTPPGGAAFRISGGQLDSAPTQTATITATDLQPGTAYSARVVAISAGGETLGTAVSFTTATATGGPLPHPTGAQPPPPTVDTTALVLSALSLRRRTFAVAATQTAVSATAKGTTLRYTLSEAAPVTIAVQRALPGRRKGSSCVRSTRRLRKAERCTRYVTVMTLRRRSPAGTSAIPFSGRVGKKRLQPGKHRFRLWGRDAAGNRSAPKAVAFRVVRR
jgi:hypothetical protein